MGDPGRGGGGGVMGGGGWVVVVVCRWWDLLGVLVTVWSHTVCTHKKCPFIF